MSLINETSMKALDPRDINPNADCSGYVGYVAMKPLTPLLNRHDLNHLHPREDTYSTGMFSS